MIDDVRAYHRAAWDRKVRAGDRWTVAVASEEVTGAGR